MAQSMKMEKCIALPIFHASINHDESIAAAQQNDEGAYSFIVIDKWRNCYVIREYVHVNKHRAHSM